MTEVRIHCKHNKLVGIGELKENPINPNTHPERQIEMLSKIIVAGGWRVPITVSNRSGYIVRGHGRYTAAKRLGLTKVPVDFQDYETDEEEYTDLLADNKIAEMSENDPDSLLELLDDLIIDGVDIELSGYDFADLAVLKDEIEATTLETTIDSGKKYESLGPKKGEIKIVLCINDVSIFEEAIKKTGEKKRGDAVLKICREWLDEKKKQR